ncbi:DUF2849 domain-containing protein [Sphingomonas sp.]|uniref:DUF2849 domain-containing protein n=1 Tax=Sphingomonas sp. TaxID=28214 RepID=UPI0035BC8B13
MKILVGNDLATGEVTWWTGSGWSSHVSDAVDVGDAGAAIIATEEAARRVNIPIEVDADMTVGGPLPRHIKDRIRAAGPSVHPALAIHPELPIEKEAARV